MISPTTTSLQHALPNELLLVLAPYLSPNSLCSLTRTSQRLATLLQSRLSTLACSSDFSITTLFWAAASGSKPLAKEIHSKTTTASQVSRCDVHSQICHLLPPIRTGPGKCDDSVVDFVLSRGATLQLHHSQCTAFTSLFWAVISAPNNLTSLLRTHRTTPTTPLTSCGRSALHEAVYRGDYAIVHLLLTAKPTSIAHVDSQGRPLFYWAVAVREDPSITRFLLYYGAPISSVHSTTGRQLLHLSVRPLGVNTLAKLLLADLTQRTYINQLPLHLAARNTTVRALPAYPRYAANIDTRDSARWTPLLHLAAKARWADVVRVLLERDAEISPRDCFSSTPLYRAVWNGRNDVVNVLIGGGADLTVPDDSGKTGLDLATIGSASRKACLEAQDRPPGGYIADETAVKRAHERCTSPMRKVRCGKLPLERANMTPPRSGRPGYIALDVLLFVWCDGDLRVHLLLASCNLGFWWWYRASLEAEEERKGG